MKTLKTLKLIISGLLLSASVFLATAAMPTHSGDGKPELQQLGELPHRSDMQRWNPKQCHREQNMLSSRRRKLLALLGRQLPVSRPKQLPRPQRYIFKPHLNIKDDSQVFCRTKPFSLRDR